MKAFQLVLLICVMAASHVSWAAEGVDTQTLVPRVKVSPKDLTPAGPLPAIKVDEAVLKKDPVAKPEVNLDRANIGSSDTALPAVQRDITDKSVKRPDVSEGATPEGIKKIDPGQALGEGAGNILDADQARGMRDAKDMMDAVRNQAIQEADLGIGEGKGGGMTGLDGRPIGTPDNNAGGGFKDPTGRLPVMPGKTGGNPLAPSTNPADWMKGASSRKGNWVNAGDGVSVFVPPNKNESNQTESNEASLGPGNNRFTTTTRRDGSWTTHTTRENPDGSSTTTIRHYGPQGEHDPQTDETTFENPPREEAESGSDGDGGIAGQPGTEGGSGNDAAARWLYKRGMLDVRPDYSGKPRDMVVNPGPDGATPDPKAPRLVWPEDQLVINPDPDAAGGPGRTPDQGALERELEERRCKTQDCDDRRGER